MILLRNSDSEEIRAAHKDFFVINRNRVRSESRDPLQQVFRDIARYIALYQPAVLSMNNIGMQKMTDLWPLDQELSWFWIHLPLYFIPATLQFLVDYSLVSSTGTILMRIRTFTHVLLLVLGVTVSSAHGQFLPWNIPVNSSFRVGYLYGSQVQGCHSLIETEFGSRSTAPYTFIYVAFSPFGERYY